MDREVIQYLPPDRIECEPQLRTTLNERETIGLARSVQEFGIQAPIRVRRDGERFIVVFGERRLRAALLARLRQVPVIVESKALCEAEVLQRQLVENVQRVELRPTERARGLKRLTETTGWQLKEAAARCGISGSMATKLVALLTLPPDIQAQIDAGAVPLSSGYVLTHVAGSEARTALAQQLADGQLTRDALTQAVAPTVAEKKNPPRRAPKRIKLTLDQGTTITVAGAELTLEQVNEGLESLLSKTRRALRRGQDLQGFVAALRQELRSNSAVESRRNKDVAVLADDGGPGVDHSLPPDGTVPKQVEPGAGADPVVAPGRMDAAQRL